MKYIITKGQKFGRWTVIDDFKIRVRCGVFVRYVNCKCQCGAVRCLSLQSLVEKKSESCGCLMKELAATRATKHKQSKEPVYKLFMSMKSRCYNKHDISYINYGGRGITICKEWLDNNELFLIWACNNGYKKGLTIERINNNKGYSPDNCTFVDYIKQANNKRNNKIVEYNGERLSLADFCRKYDYDYPRLQARLTTHKKSFADAIINCKGYKGVRIIHEKQKDV